MENLEASHEPLTANNLSARNLFALPNLCVRNAPFPLDAPTLRPTPYANRQPLGAWSPGWCGEGEPLKTRMARKVRGGFFVAHDRIGVGGSRRWPDG